VSNMIDDFLVTVSDRLWHQARREGEGQGDPGPQTQKVPPLLCS
jgi:hypothetical protein